MFCVSHLNAAENPALIQMFGGAPGSPLPHAYSYGVPEDTSATYTLRIAVIDKEIQEIFYDTTLTIAPEDKIVRSVHASRAYRTLAACSQARDVILSKLAIALTSATSDATQYQLESADGETRGAVSCEQIRHYPMPILRLLIDQ